MEDLLNVLKWRYAVKKFDAGKKIAPELMDKLKEVLQLVPTSNGLQPYKFLLIETPSLREELRKHSFDQPQVTDASHLIVFCSYKKLNEEYFDKFIQLNAETQEVSVDKLINYSIHLKNALLHRSEDQTITANEKQCYIALGQLLQAAAIYQIDASPMEGFIPEKYNEVLQLDKQNLTATVICALGYRSEEDNAQHRKKVRKETACLFENR